MKDVEFSFDEMVEYFNKRHGGCWEDYLFRRGFLNNDMPGIRTYARGKLVRHYAKDMRFSRRDINVWVREERKEWEDSLTTIASANSTAPATAGNARV